MERLKKAAPLLFCGVCYSACIGFSIWGWYLPSGFALMAGAVGMYGYYYRRTKNLLDFGGLFSLFWLGGQAVACFGLDGAAVAAAVREAMRDD